MSPRQPVRIANPLPGQVRHLSYSRARECVDKGFAKFDPKGRVVFLFDRSLWRKGERPVEHAALLLVAKFRGLDAFPDRAVLPPSPSVLDAMRPRRGPLRPPLAQVSR